jgi:hypothetical protein
MKQLTCAAEAKYDKGDTGDEGGKSGKGGKGVLPPKGEAETLACFAQAPTRHDIWR